MTCRSVRSRPRRRPGDRRRRSGRSADGVPWCGSSSPRSGEGEVDAVDHARRISTTPSTVAGAQRLPLVVVLARAAPTSSRASPALEGWGRLAKALVDCSGRPDDPRRRRPGGVRAGAAARARRPRRDDRGQLRLRQRPGDGRPSSPASRSPSTSSAGAEPGPPHRRAEPRGGRPGRRRRRRRGPARLPPQSVDEDPARWPTDDPPTARARGRRADPGDVDRQLRRPRGRRRDRRRRTACSSCAPLGAQRRHRLGHDRRPPDRHRRQPADGAGRHARHPGVAEGGPLRRRSATPSTCRSSRSSTRPASTRARTSSGGA